MRVLTILLPFFFHFNICAQEDIIEKSNLVVYPFDLKDSSFDSMDNLDSIMVNYQHFFAAEYHGRPSATLLQKKMVAYLLANRGLDKIILERSYGEGFWLDKYLKSGDSLLLIEITRHYSNFSGVGSEEDKFERYYKYYRWLFGLLKRHQLEVTVIGIDVYQASFKSELWAMSNFINYYDLKSELLNSYKELERLYQLSNINSRKMKYWLRLTIDEINNNSSILEGKMGQDWFRFEQFLVNLSDLLLDRQSENRSVYRDSVMYKNFITYVSPEEVIYAQFGHGHTPLKVGMRQLKSQRNTNVFVQLLNQHPSYTDKIMNINVVCFECIKVYSYLLTESESEQIAAASNYRSSIIDFRNATNELEDFSDYFKFGIFIYEP